MQTSLTWIGAMLLSAATAIVGHAESQQQYDLSTMPRVDVHTHFGNTRQIEGMIKVSEILKDRYNINQEVWINLGPYMPVRNPEPLTVEFLEKTEEQFGGRVLSCISDYDVTDGLRYSPDEIIAWQRRGIVGYKMWAPVIVGTDPPEKDIFTVYEPNYRGIDQPENDATFSTMTRISLVGACIHIGQAHPRRWKNPVHYWTAINSWERVLDKHPKLVVVMAHMFNLFHSDEQLDYLSYVLETYPNVYLDFGGRIKDFYSMDREHLRSFIITMTTTKQKESRLVPCSIVLFGLSVSFRAAAFDLMAFPGDGWETATPKSQNVDSAKLRAAIEYLEQHSPRDGVSELAIVRNGRMIHQGPDIDKMHGIWSGTKSFTSTVLGLLIDDGKCRLHTLAKDLVPTMAANYPGVTLRHFASMTSGYRAVGDEPRGGYLHGPSRTPFQPGAKPLFSPPGSKYAYWDSAMNQFANVLTQIAGEPMEEFFKRRIADPIGMNRDKWDWGDFGKVDGLVVNGGSGNSNRHMKISAREMARFGHLFLNRGKWNGRQLISEAWVDTATTVQVPPTVPLAHPESGIEGPGMYGFNWWVNGRKPDGNLKWPGVPAGTYAASGHNNNDMFVIPQWDMVIVRLGLDQSGVKNGFAISDEIYATFLRKVGSAVSVVIGADN